MLSILGQRFALFDETFKYSKETQTVLPIEPPEQRFDNRGDGPRHSRDKSAHSARRGCCKLGKSGEDDELELLTPNVDQTIHRSHCVDQCSIRGLVLSLERLPES